MESRSGKGSKLKLNRTQQHYDTYPYDVGVRDSEFYHSPQSPIGRFMADMKGGTILDIGCGPGNVLVPLGHVSNRAVGLDLSRISLIVAEKAVAGFPISLVQGNALALPFSDQSFDFVIAAGSLHHTPNAKIGFREACRVLGASGFGFFALYHANSYYFYLYHTLGFVARLTEHFRITALLINRCLFIPMFSLYFLLGRYITHRKFQIPSYTYLVNYFADQILNPVVSFHTLSEITQWTYEAGFEIVSSSYSHAGSLINIEIRRKQINLRQGI